MLVSFTPGLTYSNSQDPKKWYNGPLYKQKLAINQKNLHFIDQLRWEKKICKCSAESQRNAHMSCLPEVELKMPGSLNTVELNSANQWNTALKQSVAKKLRQKKELNIWLSWAFLNCYVLKKIQFAFHTKNWITFCINIGNSKVLE